MSIRWRSGALGSMNVTMLTYPKNLEGSITILGEKGTVRIGGVAVNEIQHWEFAEPTRRRKIKDASYQTTSVYGFGHPLYYDNVINVLRGEAQPETDGREGLKSLETLIATYLSRARRPAQSRCRWTSDGPENLGQPSIPRHRRRRRAARRRHQGVALGARLGGARIGATACWARTSSSATTW
jgi:hypothetical protein